MTLLLNTLQSIAPVFILALIGFVLKQFRIFDQAFIETSSRLVFNIALPCLVFIKLSDVDFRNLIELDQILFVSIATILSFLLIWVIARIWIDQGENLGAFVQGSFRSNFSIVGFAVIWELYGEKGLAQAAVLLAFLMPLYNFLAVILLTSTSKKRKISGKTLWFQMITNPLIISVIVGVLFSVLKYRLIPVFDDTAEIISRIALPLALLGIGGSLNLTHILKTSKMAVFASIIKIIILPVLAVYSGILLGYRGIDLAILFILFGCPTAVASYVMAEAMGSNSVLASQIILISTMGSAATITAGIAMLTQMGFLG